MIAETNTKSDNLVEIQIIHNKNEVYSDWYDQLARIL